MNQIVVGKVALQIPEIGLGCYRIAKLEMEPLLDLIRSALGQGINFFDHADIYGGGESEIRFVKAIRELGVGRSEMILQSKCGIRRGCCFDLSREHILQSVDGILARLETDYLDILLLHRPDALMEPDEIADAFRILKDAGKVRHFGVSNMNPGQIALLRQAVAEPILFNQLQMSITDCVMIDTGLNVNMSNELAVNRDGGILDYCRLHGITIQAWSPFQHGFLQGPFIDNPQFAELNQKLEQLAEAYSVGKLAVAVAWILRHPARIQTLVGTTRRSRLDEIGQASGIRLSREEWYELYKAAGKRIP